MVNFKKFFEECKAARRVVHPRQPKWIFKDRFVVNCGMFGFPITLSLLVCAIIMLLLFVIAWSIEGKILMRALGFKLPLFVKLTSFISTIAIFSFLLESTGVIYFVVTSSLVYFVTHSMLLSGLLEFYHKFNEYDKPLMNMLYLSQTDYSYYGLLFLCFIRVLMGIPFSYYALVLFLIRSSGGNGWSRIPPFKLEKEIIPKEIIRLNERYDYISKIGKLYDY